MSPNPRTDKRHRLAVVEDDKERRDALVAALSEHAEVVTYGSLEDLRLAREPHIAAVAVLGPSQSGPAELKEVEELSRHLPLLGIILLVETLTTSVLQQALRSGVKDVLSASPDSGEIMAAVERVSETFALVPVAPASRPREADGHQSQVITVFSPKGGTGKSVIVTNLAILLARRTPGTVAIVDADLQFGDVSVMLKLAPKHTVIDAVAAIERLDRPLLESLLTTHGSGVKVLPAPVEPAFADQVGAGDMLQIIRGLRAFCDVVIIDTPASFNEIVLSVLDESDVILIVAGLDIPNIKNVKIGLQTLRMLNTPVSKIKLILNRANSKVKLDVGQVEKTLQLKADSLIPSDVAVPRSVNKGIPIVEDAPKSGVSRALESLADLFIAAPAGRRRR